MRKIFDHRNGRELAKGLGELWEKVEKLEAHVRQNDPAYLKAENAKLKEELIRLRNNLHDEQVKNAKPAAAEGMD